MQVTAVISAIVALGLAAAGALLTIDEVQLSSARFTASQSEAGKIKAPVVLADAIARFEASSGRTDVIADATQLQRRLVEHIRFSPEARTLLPAASRRLRRFNRDFVAGAPMPGRSWCDLSALMLAEDGADVKVEKALDICFDASPYSTAVIETRWRVAVIRWPYLGETVREKFVKDVEMMLAQSRPTRAWASEQLAGATARYAPRQSNAVRELIASKNKELAAVYDGVFLKHRNGLMKRK